MFLHILVVLIHFFFHENILFYTFACHVSTLVFTSVNTFGFALLFSLEDVYVDIIQPCIDTLIINPRGCLVVSTHCIVKFICNVLTLTSLCADTCFE